MPEPEFEEDAPLEAAPAAVSRGLPLEPAEAAVQRLEEQLREATDRHLRLAAEFDNYRKRVARERLELADRAQAALVIKLLDILDDVDRIVASDPQTPVAALLEATLLVDKKLRKELEAAGLERVDPAGQPFDPAWHEAVSVVPPARPEQDHTVAATFQIGYRFRGTLVRPARVQVYSSEGHA
ncbi:MAG TPA: nucleotide exchange factor GrpE [Gemmatimonadales bacterium]|nr:nucleotide exchange factor GrpE [Gemmatimonadales bacterium]